MKQTLQPSRRAIHTLACVDVLNLNDPAAYRLAEGWFSMTDPYVLYYPPTSG
jgi:hypothetical protein